MTAIVWGIGRHGGGVSAARHLASEGRRVAVVDAAADIDDATRDALTDVAIDWRLGDESPERFADADLVVVNPAIPLSHPTLIALQKRDVPLTTELVLTGRRHARCLRIAVTGTNGKSTLAASIAATDVSATGRRLHLGGNFERDLLGLPGSLLTDEDIAPSDGLVVEVSSFQAAQAAAFGQLDAIRPDLALFTGITPNHLDWHGSEAAYHQAKIDLLEATASDGAIIAATELGGLDSPAARIVTDDLLASAVDWLGRRWDATLSPHPVTLPHRRRVVHEANGLRFVDDSAATTPEATYAALRALRGERIGLIVGGRNKGFDLDAMAATIGAVSRDGRIIATATIGETAAELAKRIAIHGGKVRSVRTLAKAVRWLPKILTSGVGDGGTILLSPGMASVDQFADYRDRGTQFAALAAMS